MNCPLCDRVELTKNKEYPFMIHEYEHSYLMLGEHQYYKGYCVQVLKKHYREMTDLPQRMREEFFDELMHSHQVLIDVFQPKKMNMCSLGNVVDHLHWHFFPRYEDDANFKNPPWLQMHLFDSAKVTPEERDELVRILKKEFSHLS